MRPALFDSIDHVALIALSSLLVVEQALASFDISVIRQCILQVLTPHNVVICTACLCGLLYVLLCGSQSGFVGPTLREEARNDQRHLKKRTVIRVRDYHLVKLIEGKHGEDFMFDTLHGSSQVDYRSIPSLRINERRKLSTGQWGHS